MDRLKNISIRSNITAKKLISYLFKDRVIKQAKGNIEALEEYKDIY